MLTYKFLHIVSMFGAVTLFIGGEVMFAGVTAARDVPAIRRLGLVTKKTDTVGILLLLLGIAMGVVTGMKGRFDFSATWLVIAYVLVGVVFLVGMLVYSPRTDRILKAAEASPDDRPSEDLIRLIDPRTEIALMVFDVSLWGTIIYLMVVKPFA